MYDGNFKISDGNRIIFGVSDPQIYGNSGVLTFRTNGTDRMYLNADGNLGIGVASPADLLHIYASAGTAAIRLAGAGVGTNTYRITGQLIGVSNTGFGIYDTTNSTYRLVIDGNGNVGIGTTTPVDLLTVQGNININYNSADANYVRRTFATNHAVGNRGANLWFGMVDGGGMTGMQIVNGASSSSGYNSQFITFVTHEGGISVDERMRITSVGNVGIGTTSPSVKLHVDGFFISKTLWSDTAAHSYWGNYSTAYGRLTWDTGLAWINATAGNVLYLGADGANKHVTIATSGNVGIGTSSPNAKLDVNGSIYLIGNIRNAWGDNLFNVAQYPYNTSTSPGYYMGFQTDANNRIFYISNKNEDGSATDPNGGIIFRTGGTPTNRMLISYTGNVGIGTTSPAQKLSVTDTLSITNSAGTQYLLMGNQDSTGVNNPAIIQASNGSLSFGGGTSWSGSGGTFTSTVFLSDAGNVGIGTTSPAYKLDVTGEIRQTGNNFWFSSARIGGDGSGNIDINYNNGSSPSFTWYNGGTSALARITSTGNMGIGTTSPASPLSVQSNAKQLRLQTTSGPTSYFTDIGSRYDSTHPFTIEVSNGAATATEYFGIYADAGGANNRIALLNGNVGINTTTTTNGQLVIYNSSGNTLSLQKAGGGPALIMGSDTTNYALIEAIASGGVRFYTGNGTLTEKMRIAADGNVGIGTSSPTAKLEIAGFSTGAGLKLNYGNSSGTIEAVNFIANGAANGVIGMQMVSAGVGDLWLGGSGGRTLTLYRDGNVGIGITSPTVKLTVSADVTDADVGQLRLVGSTSSAKMLSLGYQTTSNYGFISALIAGTGYSNLALQPNGGNVGIGTPSANNKLDVVSATANNGSPFAGCFFSGDDSSAMWRCAINLQHNANTTIAVESSIGLSFAPLSSTSSSFYGSAAIKAVRPNTTANNQDTDLAFWTRTGASNNTVDTEKVRITGNGSVLIGVNGAYNSSRLLQVKDGLLIGNSFYTFASIDTSGTADLILSSNANPANLGSNSNIIFKLGTSAGAGPEERMRIVSNGNVGIGTTSPTQKLEVNGTIKATSFVGTLSRTSTTQTITGNSALTIDVSAAYIHIITVEASGGVFGISSVTYNNRKAGPEVDEIILIFKWPASGSGSITISNTIGDIPFNYGKATVSRLTSYKGTTGLWIAETVASNIDYTNL